ncbi:hypothetical protein BGZ81_010409 [Podila clonocystis]|nr:hypothetical protein BGZ81_010409 [Podila clonocystis]
MDQSSLQDPSFHNSNDSPSTNHSSNNSNIRNNNHISSHSRNGSTGNQSYGANSSNNYSYNTNSSSSSLRSNASTPSTNSSTTASSFQERMKERDRENRQRERQERDAAARAIREDPKLNNIANSMANAPAGPGGAAAQSTGATIWNKLRAAKDIINTTITGEEHSDDSDYEGESHVMRTLRELNEKREADEIAQKISELEMTPYNSNSNSNNRVLAKSPSVGSFHSSHSGSGRNQYLRDATRGTPTSPISPSSPSGGQDYYGRPFPARGESSGHQQSRSEDTSSRRMRTRGESDASNSSSNHTITANGFNRYRTASDASRDEALSRLEGKRTADVLNAQISHLGSTSPRARANSPHRGASGRRAVPAPPSVPSPVPSGSNLGASILNKIDPAMQRNNDNKYSSEDNAFVANPASANVIENLNATSSHANQNPAAKAMRSGQQHEVAYEVAGPTVGGMAPQVNPYYADGITDSMSKAKISEGTSATTTTTATTKPVGPSLTDSVSHAGAKAVGAVGAVAAGAAAAGSNLVNAAKNLVLHHDAPAGSMDSPHPHPVANMSGRTIDIKSQTTTPSNNHSAPKTVDIEPIHSTGLNNPVAPTHHHSSQVPKGEVASAGVIGATSATIAAPPMNDTVKATPGYIPSESSSHPTSHSSSSDGLSKMASTSTTSTLTPPEEKHLHEHRSSIKDKVKNVFHRRPSAQAAAEAEATAAAAAEAAKTKAYDPKLDRFEPVPDTPYTSSGAPKADLHAAPGKPAVKLDAHPTTTLNQGHNSRHQEALTSDLGMRKTSTTSSGSSGSSHPVSEKVTAPIVGAATTVGTAAAGTAAYMSNRAKETKDAVVDSTNTSTCSNKSATPTPYSTPVVNTTSSYAPATSLPAVERRPLTEKIAVPVAGAAATVGAAAAGTAAYIGNKARDAKDSVVDTANNLTHSTKPAAHTTTTYSAPSVNTYNAPTTQRTTITTSESSRPLTEKITAPVVGAASAVGSAATGTAAYVGNKTKDAKDAIVGSGNNLTHGNQHAATTSYTAPAAKTSSYTTPGINASSYSTPTVERTNVATTGPSRPITEKITAPVAGAAATVGAAAAGTAAYMGSKVKGAKDAAAGTGNAYNSSSYTTTTPLTTPTVSSYSTHTTPMNTSSNTTTSGSIPAQAPTSYSKTTTTSSSGVNPMQVHSDKIVDKTAIPAAYKGPIPKAGPGEEVVWVKTTTTTDYYDTDKGVDKNGDVVETHQNVLDPNSFQTEHDNVTTYVSDGHGGKVPQK